MTSNFNDGTSDIKQKYETIVIRKKKQKKKRKRIPRKVRRVMPKNSNFISPHITDFQKTIYNELSYGCFIEKTSNQFKCNNEINKTKIEKTNHSLQSHSSYSVFKSNPYPLDFNNLEKNKWSAAAKQYQQKKSRNIQQYLEQFGECQCEMCCEFDSCLNSIDRTECNDEICGLSISKKNNCKNRQFKNLKPEKNIYIKLTSNKGFGLFAKRDFQLNELICDYIGEIITENEMLTRSLEMENENAEHYYFFRINSNIIIDATHCGNAARFCNHSCDPNCYTALWTVYGEKRIGIFAMKNINVGEELTFYYHYKPTQNKKIHKCLCGAQNCTGAMGYKKNPNQNNISIKKKNNVMENTLR